MDLLFKYWPYLVKLNDHKAEIAQIQTLLGPTLAELQKVWPQLLPLLTKLAGCLTAK